MKRRVIVWMSGMLVLAALVGAFQLSAASAQSEMEMRNQAWRDYQAAEADLNVAYKQVMGATRGEQKSMIVKAETAWVRYRDANAEAEAFINKGGTIYPMVWNTIATRMTKARTKELQAFLSETLSQ